MFIACERTLVVILTEEEREVERRREGGLVGETEGKGDPERGVRRGCVCEGARARRRERESIRVFIQRIESAGCDLPHMLQKITHKNACTSV